MTAPMQCIAPSDLVIDIDGEEDASQNIIDISLNMHAETMLFSLKIKMYLPEYSPFGAQETVQSMFGITIKTPSPCVETRDDSSSLMRALKDIKYRFDMKQIRIEAKENFYICGFWQVHDVVAHFDRSVVASFSIEGTLWLPKQSKG